MNVERRVESYNVLLFVKEQNSRLQYVTNTYKYRFDWRGDAEDFAERQSKYPNVVGTTLEIEFKKGVC